MNIVDPIRLAEVLAGDVHACPHVFAGDPVVWLVCAVHPTSGVLCKPCMEEHIECHAPSPLCISCGGVLGVESEPVYDAVLDLERLRLTNGGLHIAFGAHVQLVGCNRCRGCVDQLARADG